MISRIQWQSPGLFWISAIAMVAILLAALLFYRPQLQPLLGRAPWAWVLPWVRTLGLGVLAIALLRPAIVTPINDDDPGMIAVLIDRSRSMNAADSARRPEQFVRIAAGLGRVRNSPKSDDAEQLRQRVSKLSRLADDLERANAELNYARQAGRGIEAASGHVREAQIALAAEVKTTAASTSLSVGEDIAKISPEQSPGEQITRVLAQIESIQMDADSEVYQSDPLIREVCDKLAARTRIELVADSLTSGVFERIEAERTVRIFADATTPISPAQLKTMNLTADEIHTDLVGQLRELHRRLTGQHVAAVVLFSDGRENNQTSPEKALVDWPEVSIFAIDAGSAQPKDLVVHSMTAPSSVAVGETVYVRADVRSSGFEAKDAEIIFAADQQRQSKRVDLTAEKTEVEFKYVATHAGPSRLTVEITPQSGEATIANNRVSRTIKVTSDRSTVAVLAGPKAADMQRLRPVFKNFPGIRLLDGPIESGKCALSVEDLSGADVVVLADVPLDALDSAQWDAINRAVTRRGGSIIVCAGEAGNLASYAGQSLIASMLPWRGEAQPAWRNSPMQAGPSFRIAPADRSAFDVIKLSDDPTRNRQRWNLIPPVARMMSLPPLREPPAKVRVILRDRDSGSPLLTVMDSGAGHAYFVGTDELDRWQDTTSDEPQERDRFWFEFLRIAGQVPYAVTDGDLSLDADRLSLEPGEALKVRARVPRDGARLRVERDGSLVQEKIIDELAQGKYETTLSDLQAGDYVLHLIAADHQISLPLVVAASDEDEMRDVSGNSEELARLAGTRGAVLPLSELPTLPQKLSQLRMTETRFNEVRLWDSPYLFMFVVGCLGAEWAIRKHVGLT